MLTIQCTKKLADLLKIVPGPKPSEEQDPLYTWHSHVFIIQRKKYVIVMNNKSRYNFVLGPLKKKELDRLDMLIREGIEENLLADKLDTDLVEQYLAHCGADIVYTKTSERAIISQMNEAILIIKHIQNSEDAKGIPDLNRFMNHFVMLKLPLTYSRETMIAELESRYT